MTIYAGSKQTKVDPCIDRNVLPNVLTYFITGFQHSLSTKVQHLSHAQGHRRNWRNEAEVLTVVDRESDVDVGTARVVEEGC